MWMALMVREGEYAAPTHKRKPTPWSLIAVYCRECYSNRHYLYFNLRNATYTLAAATDIYGIFLATKELGMSNDYIGKVAAWTSAISLVLVYPFGVICDRFRPIRVLLFSALLHAPMALIAFYFMTGRTSYVVITLVMVPINALMGAADMPFYAMIPPRERYGQFGAANQVVIGLTQIGGAFVAGCFMDYMTHDDKVIANYRYLFMWSFVWQLVSLVMMFLLYRSWLRHGGPDNYVPPAVGEQPSKAT
jgi:nitrate/nitrite transporter NarK